MHDAVEVKPDIKANKDKLDQACKLGPQSRFGISLTL